MSASVVFVSNLSADGAAKQQLGGEREEIWLMWLFERVTITTSVIVAVVGVIGVESANFVRVFQFCRVYKADVIGIQYLFFVFLSLSLSRFDVVQFLSLFSIMDYVFRTAIFLFCVFTYSIHSIF